MSTPVSTPGLDRGFDVRPASGENFLKTLLLPDEATADAATLGQQGMWVCLILGVLGAVDMLFAGHPVLALLTAAVYLLGGMGVRVHRISAAVLVACLACGTVVANAVLGVRIGALAIFAAIVLLANIRNTALAYKHGGKLDLQAHAHPVGANFEGKLIDVWPPRVWPRTAILFFVLAVAQIGLLAFSTEQDLAFQHAAGEAAPRPTAVLPPR